MMKGKSYQIGRLLVWFLLWVPFDQTWATPPETLAALKEEVAAIRAELADMKALQKRLQKLEAALAKYEVAVGADPTPLSQPSSAQPTADRDTLAQVVAGEVKNHMAKAEQERAENEIRFGGALRFQYDLSDVDPNQRERGGDIDFDTFSIEADGRRNDLLFSVEWRWYRNASFIHHGWVGYDFSDHWQGQFGVHRVPFGLLPYASHTYFFSSNYYLGLEDDYDTGIKLIHDNGPWNLQFAFYKNDEWGDSSSFGPDGGPNTRYSYDVTEDGYGNREKDQGNVRVVRTFSAGDARTELGFSVQYGGIYNEILGRHNGDHVAAAAHLNGNYGSWNLMAQALTSRYDIQRTPLRDEAGNLIGTHAGPAIVNGGEVVNSGAYAFDYNMPAEADSFVLNLAYDQNVAWGPIKSLKFYTDNTYVVKRDDAFDDTQMNILGVAVNAWPWYIYVDIVSAVNNPFVSPYHGGNALTNGLDLGRKTRFNINFGYYW